MRKTVATSILTILLTTTVIGTAMADPYIYRYRGTDVISATDPSTPQPPIDDDDPTTDPPGDPGDDGDDDDIDPTDETEQVCGTGSDTGELGCSDYSDPDTRGDLTPPTMVKPEPDVTDPGDDEDDPSGGYGSVQRCFRFSGGYGNYTVSSMSWGDSDWLDYQEIVPMDRPALPWERPGYNMTASYPSNSAFPRKVTDGQYYCIVYHLNGTIPEDYEGWSLGTSVSVSDYAPEDMEGDRAKIMADRSNGLDFGLSITRGEVIRALNISPM